MTIYRQPTFEEDENGNFPEVEVLPGERVTEDYEKVDCQSCLDEVAPLVLDGTSKVSE